MSQQFNPRDYITDNLDEEQIKKIKEIFDVFDSDRSGKISPKEMQDAIKKLNMEAEAQTIMDIIADADNDDDCEIDFSEFLKIFGFTATFEEDKTLDDLFNVFDEDRDGFVTYEDFYRICRKINERYSENELKEMIEYASKEEKGKVSKAEFENIVKKKYAAV
ncbi:EF-hand protein (macronuclear) [Tetrahymena thermophila SB210]|uniref:Calmodulin n=1 Tax=Tetrahymena thermophila (strain SB210) TaxID=312017 RepID=I7MMP2_TETTS|nr:EF-hand protein [Tetrahymena thermophila SB210]EAS06132.1 EF-hand protein [Tetrahymena thermophila SB210]|eukprot:XP_001026377.1 EF-hand protein [Tetrahymena thermophila SB210]